MGAFFTNIQLKSLNAHQSELIEKVIECITNHNLNTGFVRVDSQVESDKTVIISTSNDTAWVSIYDEELECQGSTKLNKLSSILSKQFNTAALSILVNDSNYLYVGLNINGTLKDSISNLSKKIDFDKSKPTFWSNILLNNYSFEDIKKSWGKINLVVEDFLIDFAKFIDLDTSKLLTGYEYLSNEKPNEGTKLYFAKKDRKKAAELGLTKFSLIYRMGSSDVKCDEKFEIEWMITNHGASSKGLDIMIVGECIEKSLLMPEFATVSHHRYKDGNQTEFKVSFIETYSSTDQKIFFARIEEIYIAKGFQPIYPMTASEGKRYGKIWYDSAIKFSISFIGKKIGIGRVTVFFTPLVNRQEGSYCENSMTAQVS